MNEKPRIEYVGRFYVYGSEAKQLELKSKQRKQPRTQLPQTRPERALKLYIDPVALVSIAVALVLLVTMVMGTLRLAEDWKAYEQMSAYTSSLRQENARLNRAYRASYDLQDIYAKAIGLGMIPEEEAEHISVTITMPEPEPETTWQEELRAFWHGLWE